MSQDDNAAREQRNAVFSNAMGGVPVGQDSNVPRQTPGEMMKQDFGLDIPSELVPLSSQGKVYSVDHPLHLQELVDIKAMTAREEDILTSRAYLKKGTVITELIRSCLSDKRINPVDLIVGDRNALMVAIRITGYGAEYDAEIECSECQVKNKQVFDLSQLPMKFLDVDPVYPGTNEFSFILPYTKKDVRFRFLTGRDEEEMSAASEKMKKHGVVAENTVTTNLIYSLISVAGVTDKNKIAQFIRMMPARDSLALRSYIRDIEPGITMKQDVTCPSCGHSEEVTMPISINFLWPQRG